MMVSARLRRALVGCLAALASACADPEAPLPAPSEVVLVVNSIGSSLSVVPVDATGSTYEIALGGTTPTPVGVSALGAYRRRPDGARPRRDGRGPLHRLGRAGRPAGRRIVRHRLGHRGRFDCLRGESGPQHRHPDQLPDRRHGERGRRRVPAGSGRHTRESLRPEREPGQLRACRPRLDHRHRPGHQRQGRRDRFHSAAASRQSAVRRGRRGRTDLRHERRRLRGRRPPLDRGPCGPRGARQLRGVRARPRQPGHRRR